MEFYKKILIGGAASAPFVIEEGALISYALGDGQVSFADVVLIGAIPAGAALTIAIAFLSGGISLRFRINGGELDGAPQVSSSARRPRGRRYTARR